MFLPCAGTVIITLYFLISFRGGGGFISKFCFEVTFISVTFRFAFYCLKMLRVLVVISFSF